MTRDTVLYVYDEGANSKSVSTALEAAGYDVVSTDHGTQGIALLFVMHSVAAVVLDRLTRKHGGFNLARRLRAIHPGVPIMLLCRKQIDPLPPWVDACVSPGEPLEKLISILQKMLNHEPATPDHRVSDSVQRSFGESVRGSKNESGKLASYRPMD